MSKIIKTDLPALVAAVEANGHSVFAPSAAHRWMKCHASIRDTLLAAAAKSLSLDDEDDGSGAGGSSFFSVEGTAAHHLAEVWMKEGKEAAELLRLTTFKRDGIEVIFDDEMFVEVERYVDWCADLEALQPRGFKAIETRVTFGDLFPIDDQGGTCDHLHVEWLMPLRHRKRIRLTITDLKYGKGVRVFAERNPQGMLYAVGAIRFIHAKFGEHVDVVEIIIRVCQPRLDHFDVWTCSPEELAEFGQEVASAARACWSDNPQYEPDPKGCRFCPVRGSCNALKAEAQALADQAFGHVDGEQADIVRAEIPTGLLTVEQKEEFLRWRPAFQSVFKRLQIELMQAAEGGAGLEHFKITEGRTTRAWKNPKEAAEWLAFLGLGDEDIWKRSLISPHQAETALRAKHANVGKRAVAMEVTSTPGPRTLAPVIDPRSALAGSADVFEPVADDDDDLS